MSQKHLNTTKQYQQAYQPLPTTSDTMNNPALNTNDETEVLRVQQGLPSTHSSQHLMQSSSESDSFNENPNSQERLTRSAPTILGLTSALFSPFTRLISSNTFIVTVLCFVNLINYMDRYTVSGVLVDIQKYFGIGDDGGGFLQTAFVISYMIFAPLFGFLGDRYTRVWIMAVGVFLWTTTTLAGSFATNFYVFTTFRALVGIGEASYSTIAPTIISDLFVGNLRSKMLAVFYFAIPVGSGLGYIVGSETASLASDWRWALRVTPILGAVAVLLILMLKDPPRGESEGALGGEPTSYCTDIKDLVRNRSFMLSTAGFTCVSFVAGALAWWGPKFIHLGIKRQLGSQYEKENDVSYKFGLVTMTAGLIGVPAGSFLAQRLRPSLPKCDPYICAVGLLISAPFVFIALLLPQHSEIWCFISVFFAQVFLNLSWSIVADILLYVVVPTRRSTAEAFQILISHALGDAGSPYIVGLISEAIKKHLRQRQTHFAPELQALSLIKAIPDVMNSSSPIASPVFGQNATQQMIFQAVDEDSIGIQFDALQYALFSTCFIEVLGGIFFLCTAAYIVHDRTRAAVDAREQSAEATTRHTG